MLIIVYMVLCSLTNLAAAAMPLVIAPSTLGLTQKSPQIANFLFSIHKHFSSAAMLAAGKALPLKHIQINTKKKT